MLAQTSKTQPAPHCNVLMCRPSVSPPPPSNGRIDLCSLHFTLECSGPGLQCSAGVYRGGGGNIDGLQRFVCFMGTGQSKQESGGEEEGLFSRELGLIYFVQLGYILSGMGRWD